MHKHKRVMTVAFLLTLSSDILRTYRPRSSSTFALLLSLNFSDVYTGDRITRKELGQGKALKSQCCDRV